MSLALVARLTTSELTHQGSKLTFLLRSQLATNRKNLVARSKSLVANLFNIQLSRNMILNVTLRTRIVIITQLKRNSTRKTSYQATLAFGFYVFGFVTVFCSVI